ncbi:phosphotransferase [Xylanibacter muris]|nr:phosphotransferase [Xylanibacter muris]
MYGLYSAYGGKLSKLYWWLFRKSGLVRFITSVDENKLCFPYSMIKKADGNDTVMSFNMGSPGVEQKISILGYDNTLGIPFFAKFSQKERAVVLTRNELAVYRTLTGTGLTPKLLKDIKGDGFVYMKSEYIKGSRPKEKTLTENILQLCIVLKNYHLSDCMENADGLKMSLSHGDFCPWNILVSENKTNIIDWELAEDRPLGYDLFTYICQVSALFEPNKPLLQAADENIKMVKRYFSASGVEDYIPYLLYFAKSKMEYETDKDNKILMDKYSELYSMVK